MAEYIKREDALREICKGCDYVNSCDTPCSFAVGVAEFPAADVVEVVRCGECKHYVPTEDGGEKMCVKDADWCVEDGCYYGFTEYRDADWFCASGAKMDGDGDV